MHCASCVANIERALQKEPGIKSISVNLATEKAYLEFDPKEISITTIQNKIEKLGYKSEEESAEMDRMEHHHAAEKKKSKN